MVSSCSPSAGKSLMSSWARDLAQLREMRIRRESRQPSLRKTERSSGGARSPWRGGFCRALIGWPLPAARESQLGSSCCATRFSSHRVQRLGASGKLRSESADVRGKSCRVLSHSTARTSISHKNFNYYFVSWFFF